VGSVDIVPINVQPDILPISLQLAERHWQLLIVPKCVCVPELRQLPGLLVDSHLPRGHELHVDERLLLHGEWV